MTLVAPSKAIRKVKWDYARELYKLAAMFLGFLNFAVVVEMIYDLAQTGPTHSQTMLTPVRQPSCLALGVGGSPKRHMHIDQIKTFLEIAQSRSFNRAAEALNITQSAASSRIRVLEERLGKQLFVRDASGVELTQAGHRFQSLAYNMVMLWQRAERDMDLNSCFRSRLRIGVQTSLWDEILPLWISKLRAALPDVALQVEADYSVHLMRQLADGILDIGVLYVPQRMSHLVVEELLSETFVLVSTEDPKSSDDWRENYVYVDWGERFRKSHQDAFPELSAAISVSLGRTALDYISAWGGSCYLPRREIRSLINAGKLHLVSGAPEMERKAYAVYSQLSLEKETLCLALEQLRRTIEGAQSAPPGLAGDP